ncbi:B-cell receptor CD22-like [Hoplias malabaricus]|uniref:B-cell receptor CD22-like n=1 Tax=Hoplias malabaricus TaxID=27720 RepID=UPI003462D928
MLEMSFVRTEVMKMSLTLAPPLPVAFLLMIMGASGAGWSVKYNQQKICALKGSTVFMNGSYTHPDNLTVKEAFWSINTDKKPDMSKDPNYSGRVEYFTDEQKKHFSLKLSNVEKKDERDFYFRFITDKDKWLGYPGVQLKITELRVETPGAVTEGGAAVLKCVTTCNLTAPTFIWYKNGRPLTTKATTNNQLHLQPVSSEDAGSYSCAVNGYQHLPSPDHTLTVRYPLRNVSVSISSSGEIVEDSSVTLTCSSDAYPPVENYIWFIEGGVSPVGSGHSYRPLQSGSYYCEARNEHGAQRSAPFVIRGK